MVDALSTEVESRFFALESKVDHIIELSLKAEVQHSSDKQVLDRINRLEMLLAVSPLVDDVLSGVMKPPVDQFLPPG